MGKRNLFWAGVAFFASAVGLVWWLRKRAPRNQVRRQHQDDLLDHALADTFPASDPVSMVFD